MARCAVPLGAFARACIIIVLCVLLMDDARVASVSGALPFYCEHEQTWGAANVGLFADPCAETSELYNQIRASTLMSCSNAGQITFAKHESARVLKWLQDGVGYTNGGVDLYSGSDVDYLYIEQAKCGAFVKAANAHFNQCGTPLL